jgi:hypothetical protein
MPVCRDGVVVWDRRKEGFFRPSGARDIYSNSSPIAHAMGYDLSPATRAGAKSRGPSTKQVCYLLLDNSSTHKGDPIA